MILGRNEYDWTWRNYFLYRIQSNNRSKEYVLNTQHSSNLFLEDFGAKKLGSNAFITGPGRYRKVEEVRRALGLLSGCPSLLSSGSWVLLGLFWAALGHSRALLGFLWSLVDGSWVNLILLLAFPGRAWRP